jgi:CubicO group peptidase (beta-lactamase class C family)
MALVERGSLALDTTARSLLGGDLPLVDDRVTIVDLLAHRSGIGDYINEDILESVSDYIMPIPVHRLASAEDFVVVLDGFAQVSAPGEKFAYNNSGFVLLAVLAERAAGRPFHDLVDELVIGPAGLQHTGWERSDELPGDVALGYLDTEGQRTNVLHLPVLGTGDGGIATTADDMATFWAALFAGRIVSDATRDAMTRRVSVSEADNSYGLGFWLHSTTDAVMLEGYDAGASFRSSHRPSTGTVWSVLANTSEGAWPLVRLLSETLDDARDD